MRQPSGVGAARVVVALIATADRTALLGERALPSVLCQTSPCARIVVVDDGRDPLGGERLRAGIEALGAPAELLRNRRTRGAAGAWNTGLDHLARLYEDPGAVFVALLDDDDAWDSHYLSVVAGALDDGAEVVASAFRRITGADVTTILPPAALDADAARVRNIGIQASNLVVRLDRLLEAGLFDEALASCTDRDLSIRLADVCAPRAYRAVTAVAVNHYACDDRPRLSTPGSAARSAGLAAFRAKHGPLLPAADLVASDERARRLFGWSAAPDAGPPVLALPAAEATDEEVHLVVGLVVDDNRVAHLDGLLGDLHALRGETGLVELDVLLMSNGSSADETPHLKVAVEGWRQRGLRVHAIGRAARRQACRAGELDPQAGHPGRLAIGPARTALQTYLYHFVQRRPGAVVWILDDDMRLNALVEDDCGRRRRCLPVTPHIQALRRQQVPIAVGPYTGAAPVPAAATVRVELLDLVASLQWLVRLDPAAELPDRTAHNRAARAARRDYYYDLSRIETDRLETPFLVEPAVPHETVAQALTRVVASGARILAGESVFRPLIFDACTAAASRGDAVVHRGGNTLVFDPQALRDAPNAAPCVHGRPTRRSDMIWSLVQQHRFGRRSAFAPIAVFHDRSRAPVPDAPDVAAMIDDIRGHAAFNTLKDDLDAAPGDADARCRNHLHERLAAFRVSFHRIRGLTVTLRGLIRSQRLAHAQREQLEALVARLERLYDLSVLAEVERGVAPADGLDMSAFKAALGTAVEQHRKRLLDAPCIQGQLAAQRLENAVVAVRSSAPGGGPLRELGQGSEAVVVTDGRDVFKSFDYWTARQAASTRAMLASLPGRWARTRALYALRAWDADARVLRYGYEQTRPYRGGHGPGLVDLLVECHRHGLICRNLHPKNLRVTPAGQVRLVDYGGDLLLDLPDAAFDEEFAVMCRRAFLCWRWWHRPDLHELLRRSIAADDLAELAGFGRFFQAVRQAAGLEVPADPCNDLVRDVAPGTVLDFGCGKGRMLRQVPATTAVTAFDPDPAMRARAESLALPNVRVVSTTDAVLQAGPHDLVLCRRVACLLDDHALDAALRVLRQSVAPDGRVLLGICHPAYTARCVTPEATPARDGDHPPDAVFTFLKTHRHTGRCWQEVHRPERVWRRALGRAGLRIVGRRVRETVDLERFEPIADLLVYELVPVPRPNVTLMIKACAMDADVLADQVRHLVTQLEDPRPFAEVILCLDSRREGFVRAYAVPDFERLLREAQTLLRLQWIDRVLVGPSASDAASLGARWLGRSHGITHADNGAQVASVLHGFEACTTRYVLHADLDVMIGRTDRDHDFLADMVQALAHDPAAVTVAFNIARRESTAYSAHGLHGPWRCESRIGLVDLGRLRALLPLDRADARGALPWHRLVDLRVAQGDATSLRGGDRRTFFVHPPNARKADRRQWLEVLHAVEAGRLPAVQYGQVEWVGDALDWRQAPLVAAFIFVVCGRNVAPERFHRCVASLLAQTVTDWQAIVVDDASHDAWSQEWARLCAPHGDRIRLLRRGSRQGLLANTADAIRNHCGNPQSVILTLDADDCLTGPAVLEHIGALYAQGADLAVGGMLRTDKHAHYPVCFERSRDRRGGGNVWTHLRTFRRALFDGLPDEAMQLDGRWIELASDWALMLALVERARSPRVIAAPVYLHEPSGPRNAAVRQAREAVIAAIVGRHRNAAPSAPGGSGAQGCA